MKTCAICYRTSLPMIINKGTANETRHYEFLAYETYKSFEEAQKEVDEINRTKPERLVTGELARCDERVYFVNVQEKM